ncbi:MAG TPA: hypothetical protein DD716_06570 [Thiomicrospira sp.]|jgi:hypothetical protein|nr:hypothetical protein [Thiomicrospira sp.]
MYSIKPYVLIFLILFFLTSCCEPYKEKTINVTQSFEDLKIKTREHFQSVATDPKNEPHISFAYGSKGMYPEGDGWDKPFNPPYNYGKKFFENFSEKQDKFLNINIYSDYHFIRKNTETSLLTPTLGFCNEKRDGTTYALTTYNSNPIISDNLNHFSLYFSIPMLINKGKISEIGTQKALCIKTWDSWQKGATCGNKGIKWKFNDIRIEANQIETIMQNLKDQGIEYDYPENPIDYDD